MIYEQHHSTSSVNESAGMSSVDQYREKSHNMLDDSVTSQKESLESTQYPNICEYITIYSCILG